MDDKIKKTPAYDLGQVKNAPYPDVNDEKPLTTEEPTTEPEPTEEPRPLRAHIDFEAPGEFVPTPEPEPELGPIGE